ncbi:FAD-dependent monooxygenase [Parvibium lacunae]|uniref:Ubiquinone biosynthesis protein n=1 Tax=Parvibium lacunae TaxID=1888893 RepID=A0A368L553_9BURK|nr:FAD-dependent monooxygenase [Parvibium lacunae]RCS58603.1 ubiquinone biosynthesis protein [Parvibium lacunae]
MNATSPTAPPSPPGSSYDYDITVVGTGLIGLAAALGLAQQGWRVGLIGPAVNVGLNHTDTDWDNRVYAFSPATQQLLTTLRVWQQLPIGPDDAQARIQAVREMRVYGQSAEALSVDPGLLSDSVTFSAYAACVSELAWIAESRVVQQALATACRFQPQLHWHTSQATDYHETPAGLRLQLANQEVLHSQILLGADGAYSWVRQHAGIDLEEQDYPQTAIVANFACSQKHADTAWQWFRPDGILALLPLPGQRVSMVWSTTPSQAETLLKLDATTLADQLTAASAQTLGTLTPLTPAAGFPLKRQLARTMVTQRIGLLGDAAHVVHPLAGQGMNLGMGDVRELLDVFAHRESYRTLSDGRLLARYARRRAAPIQAMRAVTHGLYQLFAHPNPTLQAARRQFMHAINHTPLQSFVTPIKRKLIQHALYS